MIDIRVNGEPHTIDDGLTLAALIERLQLAGKKVAIEQNGEIVPRSRFAETAIRAGDQLEIVVAVGGG